MTTNLSITAETDLLVTVPATALRDLIHVAFTQLDEADDDEIGAYGYTPAERDALVADARRILAALPVMEPPRTFEHTSKVRRMLAALTEDGFVNVEFAHTGGGCYAIRIAWYGTHPGGEYLVTAGDVFSFGDFDSDDHVGDEWYVGFYSDEDSGGREVFHAEGASIADVVAAINRDIRA